LGGEGGLGPLGGAGGGQRHMDPIELIPRWFEMLKVTLAVLCSSVYTRPI